MVTFSWEGQTKQIEVKSGNLIPVSEIPEIYAPDGKAVVWYNGNNAFSFSTGINEELSLSSKVVDITAETVCDVIKSCYGDMEQLVKLKGNCSSELVIKMGAALKENPNAKIILDLGDVTGLTEIPQQALASNNALFGIILPKTGLTKIGNWALGALYNVKNIEIPASVTVIDTAAFQECISLESIVIPEGIAQISERTFNWCESLETITIPVTVTSIGFEAFNGCEALTTINYAGTKALWDEIYIDDKNECLSNATINYGNISEIPTETVEVAASEAASRIVGLSGRNRVIVTGECSSETVSAIGNALKNSSAQVLLDLSRVNGLTEIPYEAFVYNNNLVEITLPESVTNINCRTFAYSNLRAINIPANVEYIDNEAFVGCAQLTNIDVAENNSYFSSENGVIYNKEKTVLLSYPSASGRVEFLDSVIRIGDYAFKNSRIETLNIPDHITSMGVGAFYNCYSLTNVESFGGVSSIPNLAFYCCSSLKSITIPENVVSIGWGVFDCCYLEVVEILGNISVIKERTFGICDKMHTITIPATVTVIEDNAFYSCKGLKTVNYAGTQDLWNQIYIGSGNEYLINAKINYGAVSEVPEIPEIPVTEISVEASEAADTIYNLSGRNRVIVTGDCSSETVSDIGNALKNSGAQILLDLSDVSGLTSIPQECFRNSNSLVEITLPESVTEIGWGAFNQCRSLKKVHSLGSISVIQSTTFNRCDSLTSLRIPASVTTLDYAISYCPKLTDIIIDEGNTNFIAENGVIYSRDKTTIVTYPSANGELIIDNSVTKIGKAAFNGCKITSLTISGNIQEIAENAFSSCEFLETVDIQANIGTIPRWAFGSCINLKSITMPSSVEHIETAAFAYCQKLTDIRIAGNNFIVENGAIYIDDGTTLLAFPSASGNVTIPETVTTIADEAFRGCPAESITIPSSVTSIGRYNFNNCHNLETVEIFAKVSVLPQSLFSYSQNLTSVTIPATVTSIEWGVFDGCENLRYVTYTGTQEMWNAISKQDGNSYLYNAELTCTGEYQEVPEVPVTEISVEASEAADTIYNLSGRNLVIVTGECDTNTVSAIGNALKNSGAQVLLDLSGVSGLTSIPQECFRNSNSLVEITLPESVVEIGSQAFSNCNSLQKVHELGNITELYNNCFSWCQSLTSVTIPSTVTSMNAPFARCPKLTIIVIEDGNGTFTVNNGAIYTEGGTTLVAYPSASGDITIDSSITKIEDEAFNGSEITSVTIPSSVTEIGWSVFSSCEYLETVDIQANIETIPGFCFGWCGNLQSITIPESVERIQNCAFIYCQNLTDISISGNNFIVKDNAIYTADGTTLVAYPTASGSVEIPETVKTIGAGAFAGSLVNSIIIPESVTTIESEAFRDCRNLQTVEILAKVSILPQNMFSWCEKLTSVTIPATVTSIEWGAFDGCSSLSNVTYTGTQEMWAAIDISQDGNSYLYNADIECTGEFTEVPEIPVTEISVAASEAANTIYNLSGRNLVIVTGECDSETVSQIGYALRENYNAQIFLDLSDVSGLTSIPQECFRNSNSLVEVTLPESVTEIGWGAFNICRNLQTVEILAKVSVLPEGLFYYSQNLTSVTIPATVTSIEGWTFDGCENLRYVTYTGTQEMWDAINIIEDGNSYFFNAEIECTGEFTEVPEVPVTEISVEASEAADTIYNLSGRNLVIVTGECSSDTVSAIGNALKNSGAQILLDLSDVRGLTSIPQECFRNSDSLVEITLPETVTEIGWGAFNQCRQLKIVHSLGSVSELQNNTFGWCENLQSLTIPATVTYMNAPFGGCPKLTNIVIEDGNNNYFAENGAIYSTDGETLVAYPSASGEITIDSSVSRIGNCAFYGSRITSVTIPATVTEIEGEAFSNCAYLETVDIRANIGTIPEWAFCWCRNLKSITIPASVERIQDCAFINCQSLTDIRISGNNFIVKDNAIYTADETTLVAYPTASGSVEIPETVKTIRAGAFAGSLVESITIPESVTTIEIEAFSQCELLYSISIPETVTSIGNYAFDNCRNLQTVEILAKVSVLPERMFGWCEKLTSVTIPATVTSIEWGTFNGCSSLSNVTYTGTEQMWNDISKQDGNSYLENASLTCTGDFTEVPEIPVTEISVEASEAANTIYNLSGRNRVIVTGNCDSNTVSQIGYALRENYNAQIFLDLSDVSGLTSIPQECFRNSNSLVEITLPESVTTIEREAFSWCSSLQSVNNLGNISTIPSDCFSGCENLTTITIPSTVETIESWSFHFCGLKQILIPASVTDVRFSAFQGCYNLLDIQVSTENTTYSAEGGILYNYDKTVLHSWPSANGDITIPSNVTTIGRAAFRSCNLERLVIPEGVTTIESEAIKNCENIVSLEIPASVTLIEGDFYDCPNLQIFVSEGNENYSSEDGILYNKDKTELIAYPSASGNLSIPEGITKIGDWAFGYCPDLESVTIPASVTEIDYGAFNDCRNLQSVEILGNISVIKFRTFENCESLESITIPGSVTCIESGAFNGCENLEQVFFDVQTGWYVSEYQDSGSDGTSVDVTIPSTNAGLLVGDYCYYYWTKVEE